MRARNKFDFGANLQGVSDSRIRHAFQLSGMALPVSVITVSGAIVTCKFEVVSDEFTLPQITVPIGLSKYVRLPIQIGDTGVVFPCDANLGGISGLGLGTADMTAPSNLTGLVFFPTGNSMWSIVDTSAVVISAPNGVELMDDGGASDLKLTPGGITISSPKFTLKISGDGVLEFDGSLTLKCPSITLDGNVIINGSLSQGGSGGDVSATMSGPLVVRGDIEANNISLDNHTHPVPQGGNTGKPQ